MNKKTIIILISIFVALILFVGCFFAYQKHTNSINNTNTSNTTEPTVTETEPEPSTTVPEHIIPAETKPIEETVEEDIDLRDIIDDDVFNVLLVGLDARDYSDYSRSDSMILCSYNIKSGDTKLVSFMRDSWVNIPNSGWNRINAATAFGGIGLLINTINENFDLDIQNYIQVKFEDFVKIIDAIGGISLDLTQGEINYINRGVDANNQITSDAGTVVLNGSQALMHCRNRSVGNCDFDRTRRQRDTVGAMIHKVKSGFSVTEMIKISNELKGSFKTNLDFSKMLMIGKSALSKENVNIETSRLPYDGACWNASKSGMSVLELDMEKNTEQLHEFLYSDT